MDQISDLATLPVAGGEDGPSSTPAFLRGGGETGTLMRSHDWATSPLGDPSTWPVSLTTTVGLMMSSAYPMFVAWGPELAFLYNDAYRPILGKKHPAALGRPFAEVWADIWSDILPLVDKAMNGEAVFQENLPLVMARNGYPEETWYTFSYSPVRGETGEVAGMFCACQETTAQVIAQKHADLRSRLGDQLRSCNEPGAIMGAIAEVLGGGLGIDGNVNYGEVDASGETTLVEQDWSAPDFPSVRGRHRMDDFGPSMIAELREGRTVAVSDVADAALKAGADPGAYEAVAARAFINAPLIRDGRLACVLSVISRNPRVWTEGEIALVEEFATRTWSAVSERRAEQALRDSERQLREVTDALPVLVATVDAQERYEFNNKAYEDWFGISRDELRGKTVREVLGEAAYAQLKPTIDRVLAGKRFTFEQTVPYQHGGTRQVRIDYIPRTAADGSSLGWYAQIRDVSERIEAEMALRDSVERLRLVQQAGGIGSFDWDMANDRVHRSPEYLALQGLGPDWPLDGPSNENWLDRVHPEDRERVETAFRRDVEAGGPFAMEYRIIRPDTGETRWLTNRGLVELSEDGKPDRLIAAQTDITDSVRARADAATASAEARRWQEIVENAGFGMAIGDARTGHMVAVNRAFAAMHGYDDPGELIDRPLSITFGPGGAEASAAARTEAEATGTAVYQSIHKRKDGSLFDCLTDITAYRDETGEVTHGAASFIDISGLVATQRALGESEEDYRYAAELNPQVAWTATPDGQLDRVADRWREWTGTSGLGDSWGEGLHPDDLAPTTEAWVHSVTTGQPYDIQHRVKHRDGRYRWARSRASARRDASGAIVRWYGNTEDIHDAWVAEQQLVESENRFRNMADHAPVMMWVTDPTGYCTYLNHSWYAFTGQTPAEAEGFGWVDATHPDDKAMAEQAFVDANAAQGPFYIEYRLRGADGRYRWAIDAAMPRFGSDGEFLGYVGSVVDIDARKRVELRREALVQLADRFRDTRDPTEIAYAAAEMLGRALDVSRAGYGFVDRDAETIVIDRDWNAPGVTSLAGTLHFRDFGSYIEDLKRGQTVVIVDAREDRRTAESPLALEGIGARSLVNMPLREEGGLVALLFLNNATPREWSDEELAFISDVAERARQAVERRRAEELLRVSEARFRSAVDAIGGLLWTNNARGEMEGEQPGWAALTGQTREQYEGLGWASAVHPEDAQPTVEAWNEAVAERRPFVFEHRVRRFDGQWRRYSIRAIPSLDRDGAITEWIGVHTDITDLAQTQAALRDSETRFRTMAEAMPGFVWTADAEGLLDYTSQRWSDYSGDGDGEAKGQGWAAFVHPDDLERAFGAWSASLADQSLYEVEFRLRDRHGDYRWWLARAVPVRDEGGEVRWIGSAADIDTIVAAREVLARSQAELKDTVAHRTAERDRLWESSQDILAAIDLEGRFLAVSPAVTPILGWLPDEMVGRSVFDFILPEDMEASQGALATATEGVLPTFENRYRHKAGGSRWISWIASPEEGQISAIGRHITAQKAAEAELALAQDALRQSQKLEAMGQLTGGVAHDFNNLLTPIIGSLDLLQRRGLGTEREQRLIDGALQSADRAKTLVQRLLAFARRQPLQATAVDLKTLITGMADIVASTSGPKVKVMVHVADDLPPAMADPNQLEMAILNLSVNARDAMPDGGALSLFAAEEVIDQGHRSRLRPGQYIRLSVSDTGVGMSPETLARAIEPFFSTKGVGKGTGLGLSMVHGLASQLGGALVLSSRPGVGTTVDLWLPVSAAPVVVEAEVEIVPERQAVGTALLVDDEELVRMSTADMLSDLGYRVVEAASAEQALALLDGGLSIDVLLTDHLMPGMTGVDLIDALRDRGSRVPVLLVSGFAEADGLSVDIPRLTKPFRQPELATCLAGLLGE